MTIMTTKKAEASPRVGAKVFSSLRATHPKQLRTTTLAPPPNPSRDGV
jgi:hypothetical protein